MPCPPDCYLCAVSAAHVSDARRCPFCLDDWLCDGCAIWFDLTDVEDVVQEDDSGVASSDQNWEFDDAELEETTTDVPSEGDWLTEDTFSDEMV